MKKRYLAVAFIFMFMGIISPKALVIGDCDVLISYKLNSSLDEDKYICKGREYGVNTDNIYYSGSGNVIKMKDFTTYYMVNYGEVTIDISGNNNISLFHTGSNLVTFTGDGLFKFKEVSYVKKVINGESVFNYEYKGTMVLDENKKIYEGTNTEFIENYETLKKINKLPEEFKVEDYSMTGSNDYTKSTSVVITEDWFKQHVSTSLKTYVLDDGLGVIEYVKEEPVDVPVVEQPVEKPNNNINNNTLEKDNVVFVSNKKIAKSYKLKVEDKKEDLVAQKVEKLLNNTNLLDLYDISVMNGKKEVTMNNGSYIIKIKLDGKYDSYENFQVIYVDDNGKIKEYIDTTIEDGYLVFKTSHLSQYGIVATPVVSNITVYYDNTNIFDINYGLWFKVGILISISLMFGSVIIFILIKSDLLPKRKKRRRKRA